MTNLLTSAGMGVTPYLQYIKDYALLGDHFYHSMVNKLMDLGYKNDGWAIDVDEHHIYGSSNIGVHQTKKTLRRRVESYPIEVTLEAVNDIQFIRGKRNYELSNHLGNVQVVISDKRIARCDTELEIERFEADVLSAVDYYPFGMIMPGRQYYVENDSSMYRFGFNGMEKDDEAKGIGNSVDFGARVYDSRLGRWLSIDPLWKDYTSFSSYSMCLNNPIIFKDIDGRKIVDSKGIEIKVTFNLDGTLTLSKNATPDVVEFVSALWNSSNTGRNDVKTLVWSESAIKIVVHEQIGLLANSDGTFSPVAGFTGPDAGQNNKFVENHSAQEGDGVVYKENTINIFKGSYDYALRGMQGDLPANQVLIFDDVNKVWVTPVAPISGAKIKVHQEAVKKTKAVGGMSKPKDITDFIHRTAVHEIVHITAKNIKLLFSIFKKDYEKPAYEREKKAAEHQFPERTNDVYVEE